MQHFSESVSGPEAIQYLEQACAVLENALAQSAGGYETLSPKERRLVAGNLSLVSSVTGYLARHVLPTLARDRVSQDGFEAPATQTRLAELGRRIDELRLRLAARGGIVN